MPAVKVLLVAAVLAAAVGGAVRFAQDMRACGEGALLTVTLTVEGRAFDYMTIELPSGVEVALTINNRDAGASHNIIVAGFDTLDHIYYPDGCLCGCWGGDVELHATPVVGIAEHTFTFVTPPPGRYVFWCDYHPDTMVGELVVVQ